MFLLAQPIVIAIDDTGNSYVADHRQHVILKAARSGEVSVIAGKEGVRGHLDGWGASARFTSPHGVVRDHHGFLYVMDGQYSSIIRVLSPGPDAWVSTLAGTHEGGSTDGDQAVARFSFLSALAVDHQGNVYVTDRGNATVRMINKHKAVKTVAGLAGQRGYQDGFGAAVRFNAPTGIALSRSDPRHGHVPHIYVTDAYSHTLRMITPDGRVTTLAGSGERGHVDGAGTSVRFTYPTGLAMSHDGVLYVADTGNQVIRKVSQSGIVTTLAGRSGRRGLHDGRGAEAHFDFPERISLDAQGNLYVTSGQNLVLRKVTPDGLVTTVFPTPMEPSA